MFEESGLPEPDRVEYGHTCIRFFWDETKVVLVVDIDEPAEGFEVAGDYLEDLDDDEGLDDDLGEFDDEEEVVEILRRLNHDDDDEEEAA